MSMVEEDPRFQQAMAAMEREDFAASFAIVESMAEEGQPLAQHFLGWHYHKGLGIEQNDEKAVEWWLRAAEQGLTQSQQGLGWAFEHGRGVRRDYVEAYRWYARAVAAGDEDARDNLFELAGRLSPEAIKRAEGLAVD
jgi:TPR repeat protein